MSELGTQGSVNPQDRPEELKAAYRELRKLSVFDGIPNEELWAAIAQGHVVRRVLDRDVFVEVSEDPNSGAPYRGLPNQPLPMIYLVLGGQIAVGVFEPGVLSQRRSEQTRLTKMTEKEREEMSLLRPPPLAREARKNLASFRPGELFNGAALPTGSGSEVAVFTVAPSVVAAISHQVISELAVRHRFFEDRLRRAIEVERDRLRNIAGVKQEILDFFIRHGVSVSGEMVRVRQLDRCIDCKMCEMACEERYGARRLTLGGYQLGMLDFVYTCRTCTDQRCIDPCEYDSIKFDAERLEVIIDESSCVGCTLCAQACPYGSIEIIDVEDPNSPSYNDEFKLRLTEEGSLEFGPGKKRMARARRIANKCDHCMTYTEQACVSACPTGALIEISAYELFNERTGDGEALVEAGYELEPHFDHREILPTDPFTKGIGVADSGLANTRRRQLGPILMWAAGLGAFVLAFAEIMLRLYSKTNSLQYVLFRQEGMEPLRAIDRVAFRPGGELSLWCGYIGAGLMAISVIYPFVRRATSFRRLASNATWFELHLMAGTVGPMFIVLHSALKLDNWVSTAFWSMMIVVVSGFVGRYLYTKVPDLLNGRELEELDHRRSFTAHRKNFPQAVAYCEAELSIHENACGRVAESWGLLLSFLWILAEDLRRPFRWFKRRLILRRAATSRRARNEMAYRTARLMLIQRRRVLMPRAQLLLHSWKKVHVPFTFVMTVIALLHIWVAWNYSM